MADMTEQLLKECEGYEYVRFTMSDINGIPMLKAVPDRHLPKFVKEGTKLWQGATFVGPNSSFYKKLLEDYGPEELSMIPVPGSFYPLPWAAEGEVKVGEFLCEPHVKGVPQEGSTRVLARKQLDRLAEMGLKLISGWEMEFMLLDKLTKSKPIEEQNTCFYSTAHARFEKFMYTADKQLFSAGINTENLMKEMAAGQIEFTMTTTDGILGPDQVFKFKQAIREIALTHDMFVTFMSMPFKGFGNGMHFNFSIWDDKGNNAFYNESQADNLSEVARYWIAGIMKHCKAICALMSPTVNCFRRYHSEFMPCRANWKIDDRLATLRVKNQGPSGCYMENRLPAGASNPYVVMAATIAAGLDGVINKIECPPQMTEETEKMEEKLPETLQEAVGYLKDDQVLCDALGEGFIEAFIRQKQEVEFARFKNWKSEDVYDELFQKERDLYLEYV